MTYCTMHTPSATKKKMDKFTLSLLLRADNNNLESLKHLMQRTQFDVATVQRDLHMALTLTRIESHSCQVRESRELTWQLFRSIKTKAL